MVTRTHLILLCFWPLCQGFGQQHKDIPDSLLLKEYDFFIRQLASDEHDASAARIYSMAYLAKAKNEKNWREMVNAYKGILHQSPEDLQLIYSDSMVYAARRTNDHSMIASAFLTKGIVYYNLKNQKKALDNFLIADGFLSKRHDEYLFHKVRFNIAKVKYYLGFYTEALPLLKECSKYFKKGEDMPYLVSLHQLSLCYIKLKEYELCTATTDLGIREAFRIEIPEAVAHFVHSEGINQYHKDNYGIAIQRLQQTVPDIIKSKDAANETLAYFYIGQSFWKLRQYEKAVGYFQKVDKAFENNDFIQPDLRENYERLIDYYKGKNDLEKQLFYINKLIAADRVLEKNFKYLSGKIYKEYNTQELIASKEKIEQSLAEQKQRIIIAVIIIILLLVSVAYLTFKHFENRYYKRKYKEFIAKKNKPRESNRVLPTAAPDINPDIITSVLAKMETFEKEKGYLEEDLKQERLAELFGTNPKYVAQIIKHYRNKKSNEYISDLKVEHMIELLRNDRKYRRYTNKALAEEVRFGTTQYFTRAFQARTGVSPGFFIKQLDLEDEKDNIIQ